jgi:hypothetical protein
VSERDILSNIFYFGATEGIEVARGQVSAKQPVVCR